MSHLAPKTHSSWAMGTLPSPAEGALGRIPSALQDSALGTTGVKWQKKDLLQQIFMVWVDNGANT